MPAIACQLRSRRRRIRRRLIDPKRDPHEQAIRHRLSKQHILQDRIGVVDQLALHDTVLGVGSDSNGIFGVRAQRLDFGNERLIEKELRDVRDAAAGVCAIGQDGAVEVRFDVYMCRAARVVAGENGGKLHGAVGVGGLQAAAEGGVDVRRVGRVAVAV